jgi:hypothetical protein
VKRPRSGPSRLDDDDYPAYTIGLAADLLGVSQPSCAALTRPGYSPRIVQLAGNAATRAPSSPWRCGCANCST